MLTSVEPLSCGRGALAACPLLICLLGLSACITTQQPTEVVIEVQADRSVREATKSLQIEVWSTQRDAGCGTAGCWKKSFDQEVPAKMQTWPVTLPVVPRQGDDLRVFEIVVRALGAKGDFLVEARAVSQFVTGQRVTLELEFSRECQALGEACRAGANCHGARCSVCRAGSCDVTGVYSAAGELVLPEGGTSGDSALGTDVDGGPDAMDEHDADARVEGPDGQVPDATSGDTGTDAGPPPMEVSCKAGHWDHDGNPYTECVPHTVCAAGEYATTQGDEASDRTCGGCPSGTFSSGESAEVCEEWSVCQPGTFVTNLPSSSQDRVCEPCAEGRFTERANQSACLLPGSCAAGAQQVTEGTDTSPPECQACSPGSYCEGGGAAPEACTGDAWDHDGDPATRCAERTVCLAGQYVAAEGDATSDRTCTSCASGAFSAGANVARCTPWRDCLAGSYVKNLPSAVEDRRCAECATGTFSGAPNQASCGVLGACEAGTRQVKSGTASSAPVCDACNRGVYCPGGVAPGVECSGTRWDHDSDPSTQCTERTHCVAGKYVASDGDAITDRTCASCESGAFSTQDNARECTPWRTCEAGSYVTNTPSATQNRGCAACEGETFTSAPNEASCLPVGSCVAGTRQVTAGTSTSEPECEPCDAGTYCAGGAAVGVPCGDATWDHDGDAATKCTPRTSCVAGEYQEDAGSAVADRVCVTCEAGAFSMQDNAPSCESWTECPAGASETLPGSGTTDRVCAETSWTRQVGTASEVHVGRVVDADGDGNVLLGGYFLPAIANGGRTWFVRRYDPAGAKGWTVQSGSERENLLVLRAAPDGSVYLLVEGKGESEFSGVLEWQLRKLDRDGKAKWKKSFGMDGFEGMHALELDDAGNVYLQGTAKGQLPGQTGPGDSGRFIRKYGPDGSTTWTWQFGGAAVGNDFMSVDGAGHVFLAGATQGVSQLGGALYACELDDTGASVWVRVFGGEQDGMNSIQSMTVDDRGSVFISGLTGTGLPGQTSSSGRFVFVTKISSEQDGGWTRTFGADTLNSSVSASADGRVFVAAGGLGDAHFDLSFVREYEPDGTEGWTRQIGKMFYMYGLRIRAGSGGRVYAAGTLYQMGDTTEDAFVSKLVP